MSDVAVFDVTVQVASACEFRYALHICKCLFVIVNSLIYEDSHKRSQAKDEHGHRGA
jgi:hypothetical protein